ncbi:MAG TPA: hypothetical protein VI793_06915 [Anaerolineales bacterium]|nr:hypothetical protein [Anaerolineales bacterium]
MPRPSWTRVIAVVFVGNTLGVVSNRLASQALIPWLWSGRAGSAGLFDGVGLVTLSAILLAAPPVLLGALGAWLARRDPMWVGLACGLWGFALIGRVPAGLPIAPGVWYAPAVLVILSSALGGWMIDLREQVASQR